MNNNQDTGANYKSNNNSHYSDNEYNASKFTEPEYNTHESHDRELRDSYEERRVIKRRNTVNTVIMALAVLAVTVTIAVMAYVMGSYNSNKKNDSQEKDNAIVQQIEEAAQDDAEEQQEEPAQKEEEVQQAKVTQTTSNTSSSSQPAVSIMYVTARDFLALKSGPGINYKRLYKIPPKAAVEVLEPLGAEFVKARYNGMEGYVAARYLSYSKPQPQPQPQSQPQQSSSIMYVTARDFLALKSGPGINYERIYKIPPRAAVELLEPISGEFVKVSYGGMVGYVAARYLSY